MRAQLIPVNGGPPITITRDITVVGRKQGVCDLVIDRGSISKMHCLIVKTDGLLFIRDLGSTNGTKVNGQRVIRGALLPSDELAFAGVKFRVHLGPDDPQAPEAGQNDATEMLSGFLDDPPPLPEGFQHDSEDDSLSDVRFVSDDSAV
ncbi:MAG: FHA domain-containing protein [Planctomycetaceae bacterium]